MPYINKEIRKSFEPELGALITKVGLTEGRDGNVNYVITTILKYMYGRNYKDINAAVGVLECAKMELYRRVAAPYEDQKIQENGDVY